MKSMPPITTNTIAIALVTHDAYIGSCAGPQPWSSRRFSLGTGSTLSRARACSVRGATRTEPSAEDRAAAAKPMKIAGPQSAIWVMTNWSAASASGVALWASLTATSV